MLFVDLVARRHGGGQREEPQSGQPVVDADHQDPLFQQRGGVQLAATKGEASAVDVEHDGDKTGGGSYGTVSTPGGEHRSEHVEEEAVLVARHRTVHRQHLINSNLLGTLVWVQVLVAHYDMYLRTPAPVFSGVPDPLPRVRQGQGVAKSEFPRRRLGVRNAEKAVVADRTTGFDPNS